MKQANRQTVSACAVTPDTVPCRNSILPWWESLIGFSDAHPPCCCRASFCQGRLLVLQDFQLSWLPSLSCDGGVPHHLFVICDFCFSRVPSMAEMGPVPTMMQQLHSNLTRRRLLHDVSFFFFDTLTMQLLSSTTGLRTRNSESNRDDLVPVHAVIVCQVSNHTI